MNADERQIVAKVEIVYSDLVVDTSIIATATESNSKTDIMQVVDGLGEPQKKWFAFRENKLDGSCHFIPQAKTAEVGWWSQQAADDMGHFTIPPTLTVNFNPKTVDTISVIGEQYLNNYPVNFDVYIYAGATLLYTHNVLENDNHHYRQTITPLFSATKMVLVIHSINIPGVPAKIVEFFTTIRETYDVDRLITMDVLEEIHYDTTGIPLGAISSNELDVVLDNFDKKFTPGNITSIVSSYLKKYRLLRPSIGVVNGNDPCTLR